MRPSENHASAKQPIEERILAIVATIISLFKNDDRFAEALKSADPKVDLKYVYSKGEVEITKISFTCDRGYSALVATPSGIFHKHYDDQNNADLLIGYKNWSIFN